MKIKHENFKIEKSLAKCYYVYYYCHGDWQFIESYDTKAQAELVVERLIEKGAK